MPLPVTKALAQNTIISRNETAPSGIDWNTLCADLSQMNILLQTCNHLLNSKGTLNPAGDRAIWCVSSTMSLGLGALHRGSSLSNVIFGLGLLAQPTGCGNVLNMNAVKSPNQFKFLTQAFNLH
ncbi:MAG TPA: hypothetical protein VH500_18995 [Nitrososphaeraceae archaeon]